MRMPASGTRHPLALDPVAVVDRAAPSDGPAGEAGRSQCREQGLLQAGLRRNLGAASIVEQPRQPGHGRLPGADDVTEGAADGGPGGRPTLDQIVGYRTQPVALEARCEVDDRASCGHHRQSVDPRAVAAVHVVYLVDADAREAVMSTMRCGQGDRCRVQLPGSTRSQTPIRRLRPTVGRPKPTDLSLRPGETRLRAAAPQALCVHPMPWNPWDDHARFPVNLDGMSGSAARRAGGGSEVMSFQSAAGGNESGRPRAAMSPAGRGRGMSSGRPRARQWVPAAVPMTSGSRLRNL